MQPHPNTWLVSAATAAVLIIGSACSVSAPNVANPTKSPTPILATASATFTPTRVIVAVEATPTPPSPAKGGVVWEIVITSKTSRQYMDFQKGTLINTCYTNWRYSLFYVVFPNGTIKGHGFGVTQTPPNCTPHPLLNSNLVTTSEDVSVEGTQDSQMQRLLLGVVKVEPNPSGDNGGVVLLFSSGACPPERRTIQIPLNNQTILVYKLSDQGQLTGCAGSGKDIVHADSEFGILSHFDCAAVPPNFDQQIIDLCKQGQ